MATNFTKVIDAGKGWTKVLGADGQEYMLKGTRGWRNNNPGNIEYGKFAKSMGAIGSDGRFAVFPTYEAGRAAKETLLFESPAYSGKTISTAISKYAPSSENDTQAYVNAVSRATGLPADTPLSSLSKSQRVAVLDAMQDVEGFRTGTVNGEKAPAVPKASVRAPVPAQKPSSVAVAQSSPQTAMDAISNVAGLNGTATGSVMAYAPPAPASVDQIAREANRVAASLPAAGENNVLTQDQQDRVNAQAAQTGDYEAAAAREIVANNVGGVADLIRNKFDPTLHAKPNYVQSPASVMAPAAPRQVASVDIPPTKYRIDLDKALGYARDTGQLTGVASILPNSALYGPAQEEIARNIPQGATYNPLTSTVSVKNRGLLTNPPIDPTTGKPADFKTYIDNGIATPLDKGTTETFPLPTKRPSIPAPPTSKSSESQSTAPDYSGLMSNKGRPVSPQVKPARPDSYEVEADARPDRTRIMQDVLSSSMTPSVQVSTPIKKALSKSTIAPTWSGADTSSLAGILKASKFPGDEVPRAAGTTVDNKVQARLVASAPGLTATGEFPGSAYMAPKPVPPNLMVDAFAQVPIIPARAPLAPIRQPLQQQPARQYVPPPPSFQQRFDQNYNALRSSSEKSDASVREAAASMTKTTNPLTKTQARSLLYAGAFD